MNQNLKTILIVAIAFGLSYSFQKIYFADILSWINSFLSIKWLSYLLTYMIEALPMLLGLMMIHGMSDYHKSVGLEGSMMMGLAVALIWTLPMLIGYAIVFTFNTDITANNIITGAVLAGLVEELFFRAFLFGQLYRYTRMGFIPSIIFGALIFASGHLYQSQDPAILMGVFMTTFMGAILFAWVYAEWKFNLWLPILLHTFMNLFWMLFSAGDNALGGNSANLFRVMTISFVIISTIIYKRKKGLTLAVNRNTIWMKR